MNTTTMLLEHQAAAVNKLLPFRVGALFMEMGTGKTRVAIEFAVRRQARISRVIWFCPVSLKETVAYEIRKHTDCAPGAIHVFDDKTGTAALPSAFWYVVGIESMSSSDRVVLAAAALIDERSFVIVDESSYIKGHRAQRTLRITALAARARYRMILTGTPLSQGIVDLYAQMRFLSPRILGYRSFYSFARNHLEYSEKYPGMIVAAHNTGWLAAKIQPYVYQVTKDECLTLPRKLYDERCHILTDEQQAAYMQAKENFLTDLGEYDSDYAEQYALFKLFTALQQVVSGFWSLRQADGTLKPKALASTRLDKLLDVVASIPAGEKVVIWSKYLFNLRQITQALEEEYGAGCVAQFHGSLSEGERNKELARFRQCARFFVATQATGGHGLTLNEARYHVFFNNGFKYSERLQAEDRSHRIGQTQPVTYIDIVSDSGIDQRIMQALAKKGHVVEMFRREVESIKRSHRDAMQRLVAAL